MEKLVDLALATSVTGVCLQSESAKGSNACLSYDFRLRSVCYGLAGRCRSTLPL